MSELLIPDWVAAVVGRLVLENEAYRRGLVETPPTDGHVPVNDQRADSERMSGVAS